MGCTSGSGTGFAARTGVWAGLLTILAALPEPGGAASAASLEVRVTGLRSTKGLVRVCLTADARAFPDCDGDPAARHMSVAAGAAGSIAFDDLPPGDYAVSLFHDQNGNGRLDKLVMVPTEGIGFSNNPRLRFGPPSFAQARIAVAGAASTTVRLRYFL